MSAVAVSRSQAERVSWSVAAVFFVIGLSLSAWFTQIPQFKAALSLDDAQLGAALLCPVAGGRAAAGRGRVQQRDPHLPLRRQRQHPAATHVLVQPLSRFSAAAPASSAGGGHVHGRRVAESRRRG